MVLLMSPKPRRGLAVVLQAINRFRYLALVEPLLFTAKRRVCRLVEQLGASSVLEVGCGACTQAIALARLGIAVTAVDVTDRMFPLRRARLPENLVVRQADGRSLPFPDRCFDLAFASLTLHEMPPQNRLPVLGEMLRVVRPGGGVVIMDYHFEDGQSFNLAGALIRLIERGAGREHHSHFLDFVACGGIPALARTAGSRVARRHPILGDRGGIFELPVGP